MTGMTRMTYMTRKTYDQDTLDDLDDRMPVSFADEWPYGIFIIDWSVAHRGCLPVVDCIYEPEVVDHSILQEVFRIMEPDAEYLIFETS